MPFLATELKGNYGILGGELVGNGVSQSPDLSTSLRSVLKH